MGFSLLAAATLASYFVFLYCAIYWLIVLFEGGFDPGRRRKGRDEPAVTILIPAYNSERTVGKAVESCLALRYPKDRLRIIAIDDGSTDGTLRELRRYSGKIGITRMRRNSGKAAALNRAIPRVRTPVVSCLDSDSVFHPDALSGIVAKFRPGVGAVTSNIKVHLPRTGIQRIQRLEYYFSIYLRQLMGKIDAIYVVPGPGSAYRTEALRKVGGFDEENLTEDMDMAFRMKEAGYRLENAPDGIVYTESPAGVEALARQRVRWYAGYFQNVEKHRNFVLNPRFAELGLFVLPINFILILAMFLILLSSAHELWSGLLDGLRKIVLTGTDSVMYWRFHPGDIPYSFNTLNVFFAIFFVMGIFVIYMSYLMSREKFLASGDSFWDFVLYTLFYFPLISAFYLISVFYYLAHRRRGFEWKGRSLRRHGT